MSNAKKDYKGNIITCPECGSNKVVRRGGSKVFRDGVPFFNNSVPRFKCKKCGKWFMKRVEEIDHLSSPSQGHKHKNKDIKQKKEVLVLPLNTKVEVNGDVVDIYSKDRPITLEEGLKFYDVDLSKYQVENYKVNNWDVTNSSGIQYTNFQLKITLKPIKVKFETEYVLDNFERYLKEFTHDCKVKQKNNSVIKTSRNLLEINIADLHLGKYSNIKEIGTSYNIEKASEIFKSCIEQLVERGKKIGFDSILLVIGSDYFNSDTMFNTTTRGTFQDEHEVWQATFDAGIKLATESVNYLANITDDLKVVVIPGNHDRQSTFYLSKVLEGLYKNDSFINIYSTYGNRQYIHYGNNLIMVTHGDEIKIKDLPLLMASEKSDLWNKTKYREIQIGHLHTRKSYDFMNYEENKGVLVRQLMSPTVADSWHKSKGFVGNVRGGEASLYNFDCGKICDIYHNFFDEEEKIDEVLYD